MWLRGSVLMRIPLLLLLLAASLGGLSPADRATVSGAAGSAAGAGVPRSLSAVSCPSVSVCYAVSLRGTILATHDAGHTWQSEHSGTTSALLTIDCPAVSVCFAVHVRNSPSRPYGVLRTTNGGSTWTETSFLASSRIACPSVTTCYSLTGNPQPSASAVPSVELLGTTDGGTSWQRRGTLPPPVRGDVSLPSYSSLACPSATVCYAGGFNAIGWTTDGGKTWQTSLFLGQQGCTAETVCHDFTPAMACPSPTTCFAGGFHSGKALVATTANGGRTWRVRVIPQLGPVSGSLSCPTPAVCFALGSPFGEAGRFATTTDGGGAWHVGHITTPYPFAALACPSTTACYAVGSLGRVMNTVTSGRTWHDVIPGIFVAANWSTKQQPSDLHLHTYTRWFTATHPWHVALEVRGGGSGDCQGLASVTIHVQNAAGRRVGAPVHSSFVGGGEYGRMLTVTGRLRLDVLSHCFDVTARIDGVA